MDFETNMIGLSEDLHVGEGADSPLSGAQLKAVVEDTYCNPEDYVYMPFEEKLRLADVMIARWQRYREAVIQEESIPH